MTNRSFFCRQAAASPQSEHAMDQKKFDHFLCAGRAADRDVRIARAVTVGIDLDHVPVFAEEHARNARAEAVVVKTDVLVHEFETFSRKV